MRWSTPKRRCTSNTRRRPACRAFRSRATCTAPAHFAGDAIPSKYIVSPEGRAAAGPQIGGKVLGGKGFGRRRLLTGAAGLGAAFWIPRLASAADPMHDHMNPAFGRIERKPAAPLD